MTDKKRAVRGGSVWEDETGNVVVVEKVATVNPMAAVRPHSDLRWRIVMFSDSEHGHPVFMHESDFRNSHTWLRGKK